VKKTLTSLEALLTFELIEIVHDIIIKKTGGFAGINHKGLILSALANPFHMYFGKELYPTPVEKAGILFFSIAKNHGFNDGNKRTACIMLDMVLNNFGFELNADDRDIENTALRIVENKISKENTFLWIYKNIGYKK
jgi:death on curing protein